MYFKQFATNRPHGSVVRPQVGNGIGRQFNSHEFHCEKKTKIGSIPLQQILRGASKNYQAKT